MSHRDVGVRHPQVEDCGELAIAHHHVRHLLHSRYRGKRWGQCVLLITKLHVIYIYVFLDPEVLQPLSNREVSRARLKQNQQATKVQLHKILSIKLHIILGIKLHIILSIQLGILYPKPYRYL